MATKRRAFLALVPLTVALAAGSPTLGAVKSQGDCPGNREIINLYVTDPNSSLFVYDDNQDGLICATVGSKNVRYSDNKA